jgi:hypothetical protein
VAHLQHPPSLQHGLPCLCFDQQQQQQQQLVRLRADNGLPPLQQE